MLFLIARKQHVSTQSESELKTSTKKSTEKFDKESLFDMSTKSSNMTMMNLFQQEQDESLRFQESSRSEESQEELRCQNESSESQEDSRSKSSSSEMTFQQQYEFKMMKMRLEMMKLEVQKLTNQKELIKKKFSF